MNHNILPRFKHLFVFLIFGVLKIVAVSSGDKVCICIYIGPEVLLKLFVCYNNNATVLAHTVCLFYRSYFGCRWIFSFYSIKIFPNFLKSFKVFLIDISFKKLGEGVARSTLTRFLKFTILLSAS